jgi:ATP-dependent DNA helicase RecG
VLLLIKDVYTEENLRKMGLNERQIKAVMYVKEKGKITNKEYIKEFLVSRQTATRDLTELVNKGLFEFRGRGKRDAYYTLFEAKMRQMRQK